MKTLIKRIQKSSRWVAILLATIVAIITTAVVANATQTITTPNAVKITYNLATNTSSAAITPAVSTSVLVMGCCTTVGDQGVGQATLQHIPSAFLTWVGLESGGTITQGSNGSAGTHIVDIDFFHTVAIQVASADTIRIHNSSVGLRAGNVTLIW
jgi:hypothetical protein